MTLLRGLRIILGGGGLLLLAYLNHPAFEMRSLGDYGVAVQLGLLGGSVLLLGWGCNPHPKSGPSSGLPGVGADPGVRPAGAHIGAPLRNVLVDTTDQDRAQRVPTETWWLLLVTLLAFALRVWDLENIVHFYVDEGNFVEGILQIWSSQDIRLLAPFDFVAAFPWVYPAMQAGAVGIFGPTLSSLRIISVVFGTLTIPAVYQLGKRLFTARLGLLAAFLLAVFPPHIHFSRLGLNNIADPLLGVLALALLLRALRGRRLGDYALAGLMLGLTQYFYEGGRLLFPPLMLLWLLIAGWRWRPQIIGLALLAGMALLVGGPIYTTLSAWNIDPALRLNWEGVDPRYYARLLLSTPEEGLLAAYLQEQIIPPFLHFVSLPDMSAFFYGGHTAMVIPPLVPVFLGGIVVGLRRVGLGTLLLLLWLLLTIMGNSLVDHSAATPRFAVAFPAIALLLALGLGALLDRLRAAGRIWTPLLILLVGLVQVGYYFGPHLAAFQLQVRSEHDQQDLLFRLRDLPADTEAYLITDDPDLWMPLLVFLSEYWGMEDFELHLRRPGRLADWDLLVSPDPSVGHAFFVEQDDLDSQAYLHSRSDFIMPDSYSPYNVPLEKQYLLLYLPPQGMQTA